MRNEDKQHDGEQSLQPRPPLIVKLKQVVGSSDPTPLNPTSLLTPSRATDPSEKWCINKNSVVSSLKLCLKRRRPPSASVSESQESHTDSSSSTSSSGSFSSSSTGSGSSDSSVIFLHADNPATDQPTADSEVRHHLESRNISEGHNKSETPQRSRSCKNGATPAAHIREMAVKHQVSDHHSERSAVKKIASLQFLSSDSESTMKQQVLPKHRQSEGLGKTRIKPLQLSSDSEDDATHAGCDQAPKSLDAQHDEINLAIQSILPAANTIVSPSFSDSTQVFEPVLPHPTPQKKQALKGAKFSYKTPNESPADTFLSPNSNSTQEVIPPSTLLGTASAQAHETLKVSQFSPKINSSFQHSTPLSTRSPNFSDTTEEFFPVLLGNAPQAHQDQVLNITQFSPRNGSSAQHVTPSNTRSPIFSNSTQEFIPVLLNSGESSNQTLKVANLKIPNEADSSPSDINMSSKFSNFIQESTPELLHHDASETYPSLENILLNPEISEHMGSADSPVLLPQTVKIATLCEPQTPPVGTCNPETSTTLSDDTSLEHARGLSQSPVYTKKQNSSRKGRLIRKSPPFIAHDGTSISASCEAGSGEEEGVCRTCGRLELTSRLLSAFAPVPGTSVPLLCQLVLYWLNVKIYAGDGKSSMVCLQCVEMLRKFSDFHRQCYFKQRKAEAPAEQLPPLSVTSALSAAPPGEVEGSARSSVELPRRSTPWPWLPAHYSGAQQDEAPWSEQHTTWSPGSGPSLSSPRASGKTHANPTYFHRGDGHFWFPAGRTRTQH